MFKRRWVRWGTGVALVLLAGVAVAQWSTPPHPAKCIQQGMTEAEVDAILGQAGCVSRHSDGSRNALYDSAEVSFDKDGHVEWRVLYPQPTVLARLRAWLGW